MEQKILTLGVLSYNNPDGLESVLKSIFGQLDDADRARVEVLVSDNSTNDGVQSMIAEKFGDRGIAYRRNAGNIGFDGNVDQVFKNGQGHYIWTLSDNDPILPGFIKETLAFLEANPDLAVVITDYQSSLVDGSVFSRKFKNCDDLMRANKMEFIGGLISQNIFNRAYLPADRTQYYGNHWIHLSVIFKMGANREVAVIKNGLSPSTDEICRWAVNGMNFTTYLCLFQIVTGLRELGYDKRFVEIIRSKMARGLPRNVASARMHGMKVNAANASLIFDNYKAYPALMALAFIMFITPTSAIRLAKSIIKNHIPGYA